jgi:dihydrofolate reductase
MLDGIKISFVALVDNKNRYRKNLTQRIWNYEKFTKSLLEKETCIIGRKTFDLTNWKGKKSWVLTRDRNWKRDGIGTIHNIDDIHLFCEDGTIYILGGISLFEQLESYVDEINLFVFNNKEGEEDWISFDMKDWKPVDYTSDKIWSYAKLERRTKNEC